MVKNREGTGDTLTMAQVMEEATAKVNIKELGIEYLRPKRAKTGGIIFEIPVEESGPKADKLAGKLKEALSGREEIRISRPKTMAELRVSGLDDSATMEKVALAIAVKGGCSVAEVKVGKLKKTHTSWLRGLGAQRKRHAY